MPIRVLSEATSHVLTSTQALNNAVSVIKELVDNALDARASSISIEIATNTLDRIVVKDDGSGIGVEDRQLLCKRGCTSKIANLDDLAHLGGTFLGFRGTALASIAELSKEVTIITRVEGEQPATTLTFGPSGKLLSSGSASHNAGTTVRIDHFLTSIPVRKQVVLKNPSKILDEIKKLLQAYALARPTVRISLKVLKAKNNKSDWSFACNRGNDALSAAAVQIVGKAIVDSCELRSQSFSESGDDFWVEALLLNPADHDISRTGHIGQYLSVDGRPINHEKDVPKSIVKKYKAYLQHACRTDASIPSKPFLVMHIHCPASSYDVNVEPSKDVVLFHEPQRLLELVEQLFVATYGHLQQEELKTKSNPASITQFDKSTSFNVLLARKKPDIDIHDNHSQAHSHLPATDEQIRTMPTLDEGQTRPSLVEHFADAMKRPPRSPAQILPNLNDRRNLNLSFDKDHFRSMGDFNTEEQEVQLPNLVTDHEEEDEYNPKDVKVNNPFTRAKAYSIRQPEQLPTQIRQVSSLENVDAAILAAQPPSSPNVDTPDPSIRVSPYHTYRPLTPGTSPLAYQNPGPPYRRHKRLRDDSDDNDDERVEQLEQYTHSNERQRSLMMNWVKTPVPLNLPEDTSTANHRSSPQSALFGKPGPGSVTVYSQSKPQNKPFRSPLKASQATGFTSTQTLQAVGPPAPISGVSIMPSPESREDNDDLRYILEFEQRKKTLNQQLKQSQSTLNPADLARIQQGSLVAAGSAPSLSTQRRLHADGQLHSPQSFVPAAEVARDLETVTATPQITIQRASNPHQNRYRAAARNLDTPSARHDHGGHIVTPGSTTFSTHEDQPQDSLSSLARSDPRAYLITTRQHATTDSHSLQSSKTSKRTKSSRLPFEIIPADAKKHNILAIPSDSFPSIAELAKFAHVLVDRDMYVKSGVIEPVVWTLGGRDAERWQDELEGLVKKWYRARDYIRGSDGDEGSEYKEVMVPDGMVSLARALKVHLDTV